MNCKNCKNEIPDGSIFCMYCGTKLVRDAKREVFVPKAEQLQSGNWRVRLRLGGQSISITEPTEAKALAKARAVKEGYLKIRHVEDITYRQAIDQYIAENYNELSPATIRGYRSIQRNRFQSVMDRSLRSSCRWQRVINDEVESVAPKTVENAWGLLTHIMRVHGVDVPDVNLPQVPKVELPFLDPEQIKLFLDAIKDHPDELSALLALHSLRRSELGAVTPADVDLKKDIIKVRGAVVLDEHNNLVARDVNKTEESTRFVPIMIPRLKDLLAEYVAAGKPFVRKDLNHLNERINRICKAADLPLVGVHGLRRSFASLAYHLKWPQLKTMYTGGWNDLNTVMKIYTYLSARDGEQADKSMARFYKNAHKNAHKS